VETVRGAETVEVDSCSVIRRRGGIGGSPLPRRLDDRLADLCIRAVQLERKLAVLIGKTGSWSPY